MKAKIKIIEACIIAANLSIAMCFGFGSYTDELQYKISGYNLQITRAKHYIDYATENGLSESNLSIARANEIISESTKSIENLQLMIPSAQEKDMLEAINKQNELDKNTEEEILKIQENDAKLQSILRVLGVETVNDIPEDFLKSMGLYEYAKSLEEYTNSSDSTSNESTQNNSDIFNDTSNDKSNETSNDISNNTGYFKDGYYINGGYYYPEYYYSDGK